MSLSSVSTALIPYTPPISAMDFIESEVEKYSSLTRQMLSEYKRMTIDLSPDPFEKPVYKQFLMKEIAITYLREVSFTIATDNKPIVATYACGNSVAMGGYDAVNKIAFIAHFLFSTEVNVSANLIFSKINELAREKIQTPIQIHLRGGYKGQSESIIQAIKLLIKQRKDLPMEIASEEILGDERDGAKSLAIDSRTGEVSNYNPCLI